MDKETALYRKAIRLYLGDNILSRLNNLGEAAFNIDYDTIVGTMVIIDLLPINTNPGAITVRPKLLHSYINQYLEKASKTILDHSGYIDTMIGDAIFAFFGLEKNDSSPIDACKAAIKCIHESVKFSKSLPDGIDFMPSIGISTGVFDVGNYGSKFRMKYTVMGSSVNTASRIQTKARQSKIPILISESTKIRISNTLSVKFHSSMPVLGSREDLKLYSVDF
jgi:adenylate cyclase